MSGSLRSIETMFRSRSALACALPVLLSFFLALCVDIFKWYYVLAGALFFFITSVMVLAGDTVKRSVYFIFFIQFVASYYLQMSLYVTLISAAFFPLAFNTRARINELTRIPQYKSLLLLLSGWIISLAYLIMTNYGELKYYTVLYDIYLLLGIAVAYEVFFLLRWKLLDAERLIYYIAVSGIVVIVFVLVGYLNNDSVSSIVKERFGSSANINPNILASYLDLTLPCAFFSALFEKRNVVKKALLYALSLIYVLVILMAATRGSIPGVAVLGTYFLWRKRSKRLLFCVLAGVVVGYFTIGRNIAGRMLNPSAVELMSDMGRVELLRSAFTVLKENHFFFGIGMNNFSLAKFSYGFPIWFDATKAMSCHNFFVEIWLGWGLPGLLGWLVFNMTVVMGLLRKIKYVGTATAVVFAVIAFSLHGLVDSVCANYSIMFVYFTIIGVALFAATDETASADAVRQKEQQITHRKAVF